MNVSVILAWLSLVVLTVHCLPPIPIPDNQNDLDIIQLVKMYFNMGWEYRVIIGFLSLYHGINWRKNNIRRRQAESAQQDIRNALMEELSGPGSSCGYRMMWRCLKDKYHLNVKRETVRTLMLEIDYDGVQKRKQKRLKRRQYKCKGPNYVYHVDGHDKLQPYGFAIHGAIDGFSRRLMWLEVGPSNSKPEFVAKYYVDCVRQNKGCPRILRMDPGTENGIMCAIHAVFRDTADDDFAGPNSYRYGKSVHNQRIEAWWSVLKKLRCEWWINLFQDLADFGAFTPGDIFQRACLRFCFMGVIQHDLDEVAEQWNNHHIRKQNVEAPHGIPNILHFLPATEDATDYITNVSEADIEWAEHICESQTITGDDDHDTYFNSCVEENGLTIPNDWKEAVGLYFRLLSIDDNTTE